MSSSCFETGAELLRLVFGFGVEESVCAKALVVISTKNAKANLSFIFSLSPEDVVGEQTPSKTSHGLVDTTWKCFP